MKVMIFSPLRVFGDALVVCLESCCDVTTAMAYYQIEQFCENINLFSPNVILFDFSSDNALKEAKAIMRIVPDVPVLALALPDTTQNVISCIDAGFGGYLPRHASVDELMEASHKVVNGECICAPEAISALFQELRRRGTTQPESGESLNELSRRESEIIRLVSKGMSNKQVADQLFISLSTVKNHLHNIFSKLQVKGRTEAIAYLHDRPWLLGHCDIK